MDYHRLPRSIESIYWPMFSFLTTVTRLRPKWLFDVDDDDDDDDDDDNDDYDDD